MKPTRGPGLVFIFITVLIDWMGIGLIIPVLPKLVSGFVGGSVGEASQWYGYIVAAYSLMLFLFSPLQGALSDRFGRRPVLLFSLLLQGLSYVFLALAPNLLWLGIARVLAGVGGGSITVAYAYVADITDETNRGKFFGILGAAFGLGFILGPAIGGLLAGFGPATPFWVAAGLALLNCFYGTLVLPESLGRERRAPLSWGKANPVGALLNLKRFPAILSLITMYFMLMLAGNVMPSIWVLHNELRFGWEEAENGYSLAFVGLMVSFVQGLLTGIAIKRLGEPRAVFIGVCLMVLSLGMLGAANSSWMMYVFPLPYFLGGITTPALQAIMTTRVSRTEQGLLQGSLMSIASVAAFIAPLVYTNVFAYFTGPAAPMQLPGSPFWLAGAIMLTGLLVSVAALGRLGKLPAQPAQGETETASNER